MYEQYNFARFFNTFIDSVKYRNHPAASAVLRRKSGLTTEFTHQSPFQPDGGGFVSSTGILLCRSPIIHINVSRPAEWSGIDAVHSHLHSCVPSIRDAKLSVINLDSCGFGWYRYVISANIWH